MEQLIELLPLDVPDTNGIIYPTNVVEKACREFEDRIQEHGYVLGECSVPPDIEWTESPSERFKTIDLGRVSHVVKHMWTNGGYLHCKIKLLSNYAEICSLLDLHFFGIPRASGAINGKICSNYQIVTVDLALPE